MKIAVVGCGTTGNLIIPKLKGEVFIIDRDIIEEKNIERQVLFEKQDVGKPKAEVLGRKLNLKFKVIDLDHKNVSVLKSDLVVDCTDNLETRFLINEYCRKNKIPWVYTGVVGDLGRVLLFNGDFCFRCLFTEVKGLDTCTTLGIDMSVAKNVAKVAIEEITKMKSRGLWMNGDWVKVKKNETCPVCKGKYDFLEGKRSSNVKFCGSSRFQFKGDYREVKNKYSENVVGDFYVFDDRILVKAETIREARKKLSVFIGV